MKSASRLLLCCLLFLTTLIFTSVTNSADVGVGSMPKFNFPQPPLTAWNGSYADRIDIKVPVFRGLEPNLALTYDSARGIRNIPSVGGTLGVGWSIGGLSVIERTGGTSATPSVKSGGHGVPAYGAASLPADGYALDGAELIECTKVSNPATSPSCLVPIQAGEIAYAARNENYERIRSNAASNTWTVTSKTGIVSMYSSLEGTNPFRWHLTSVTDRRGNSAKYEWACNPTFECSIAAIKMLNQAATTPYAEVLFITEARPDVITYATGKDIRAISQRIKASDVKAAGQRLRAYAFNYDQSLATKLSRLLSVQEFGRDATVSAVGVVSGGTSLPAFTMAYQNINNTTPFPDFTPVSWSLPPVQSFSGDGGYNSSSKSLEHLPGGDFDGDGLTGDLLSKTCGVTITRFGGQQNGGYNYNYASRTSLYKSNGSGAFTDVYLASVSGCPPHPTPNGYASWYENLQLTNAWTSGPLPIADYNGDGGDDLSVGTTTQGLSAVTPPVLSDNMTWTADANGAYQLLADVNGDGAMDVVTKQGWVWISANGTFTKLDWDTPNFATLSPTNKSGPPYSGDYFTRRIEVLDINGDGKSDLLESKFDGIAWKGTVHISTGSNFVAQPEQSVPWTKNLDTSGWFVADANADGNSDIIVLTTSTAVAYEARILLSNGKGFDLTGINAPKTIAGFTDAKLPSAALGFSAKDSSGPIAVVANIDGDGTADLLVRDGTSLRAVSSLSSTPVVGGLIPAIMGGSADNLTTSVRDYTGDGLDDIYVQPSAQMYVNQGKFPDLLTSITEPLGGKTTLTYRSSIPSADTRLPFVMQLVSTLTTDDGRGTTATTDFAYEGGRWNRDERQFMGFRTITATLPANAGETARPKVRSTYQQSVGCVGQVSLVEQLDSAGSALSSTAQGFSLDTSAPFTCLNTSTTGKLISGGLTKSTKQQRVFDDYGNVSQNIDLGNETVAGDESTAFFSYAYNLTDYLVSFPYANVLRQGVSDTTKPTLSSTTRAFDGAVASTTPPDARRGNKYASYADCFTCGLRHQHARV